MSPLLPQSVDQLLETIRDEKSTEPADEVARRALARIGEEQALEILRRIARSPAAIKTTLSRFIMYMVRNYSNEPRTPERRRPEPAYSQESVNFSGPASPNFGANRDDLSAASTNSGMLLNEVLPRQPGGTVSTMQPACTTPPRQPACTTPPSQPAGAMLANTAPPVQPVGAMLASTTSPRKPGDVVPQWQLASSMSPRQPVGAVAQWQLPNTTPPRQPLSTVPPVQPPSSVLKALGQLEFRKAFLVLSYAGSKKLDAVISVGSIMEIKGLPMASFEQKLWNIVKYKQCISESDRRKNVDWDCRNTYIYHCHVDPSGCITFKGPYLQDTSTHLHRVLGDENVLMVKFAAEGDDSNCFHAYHRIAQDGIAVGLRRYQFFVFKDGAKEKTKSPTSSPVKCYFIRMESNWDMDMNVNKPYILFNKSIHEARSIFMHVQTVSTLAKYMARFSLILSKSMELDINFSSVNIKFIDDISCVDEAGRDVYDEDGELMIHTDGTGFISEDLAKRCPRRISKGRDTTPKDFEKRFDGLEVVGRNSSVKEILSVSDEPPLLIQIRLFYNGYAIKGTLLVDKRLPPETICVRRHSMVKVEPDPNISSVQHSNSLEVVSTSNLPRRTYLSKSIIALLHYGGVPKECFLELTMNAIRSAMDARLTKKSALRVALTYGNMDDFLLARMILCGISLDDPYLQSQLLVMMREELKSLKAGKIPVSDSYNLMGTADPIGTLGPDEVCIILDNGQVSGDVLVYKHPGLHFGDIHVLKAVYIRGIEKIVGNCKYAIFFPTKGPRSLADEMANSDYDGDMYWVSRNPQLLQHFKASEPWKRRCSKQKLPTQKKPTEFSSAELERALFHNFLISRFKPSYAMSEASDSWMAFMDRLLTPTLRPTEKSCLGKMILELVDKYYLALDAPKKGLKVTIPKQLQSEKFPHFLERPPPKHSFRSTSILGLIYDNVSSFQVEDHPLNDVWLLPCFREPAPEHCLILWCKRYKEYRGEMTKALHTEEAMKNSAADEVIRKYKLMLYGCEEFGKSTRNRADIFNEALAIYQIVYNHVSSLETKKGSRCAFAWKVAGHALCELHAEKQTDDSTFVCLKSVLREIL